MGKVKVAQLCPTLCDLTACSHPGSSVHGILQARTLEWVAMPSSGGSSPPRYQTWVSCTAGGLFTVWVNKQKPKEEYNPTTHEIQILVSMNKVLLEYNLTYGFTHGSFLYYQDRADQFQQWPSGLPGLKYIFTIWFFTETVCWPLP